MARDDWRIRIELGEQADSLIERLTHADARELAEELEEERLAVSRDDDTVFVYTGSGAQAEQAKTVVEAELAPEGIEAHQVRIEHWLDDEDRWGAAQPPARDSGPAGGVTRPEGQREVPPTTGEG